MDFLLHREIIMDEPKHFSHPLTLIFFPFVLPEIPQLRKEIIRRSFVCPLSHPFPCQFPFRHPPTSSLPVCRSVTGWGSSLLLSQLSSDDFYRFCWAQSSRTWAAWRCPPPLAPWHPGGWAPSGCPPSLARPLWRTWTALSLYWKRAIREIKSIGRDRRQGRPVG